MRNTSALKQVRLKTPLLLKDVCALIGFSSWSKLSRIEAGKQAPPWEIVFAYSIIFDISTRDILPEEAIRVRKKIRNNILNYQQALDKEQNYGELFSRINFIKKLYDHIND